MGIELTTQDEESHDLSQLSQPEFPTHNLLDN